MDTPALSAVHTLLPVILERRARLKAAAASVSAEYLNGLLAEIDAALDRIDSGAFGLCETCQEPIEADRLQADPTVCFCLDHLSESELRAHQQDLDLATQIQFRLLPQSGLSVEDWDTHYRYEPAGAVGGDYCEVTPAGDGRSLFFAVGDVAGKGVAASLLMTHLSAILRSLLSLELPLAEMMARANRLFCESTLAAHYATLVCGRAAGGLVELSNAGHCPPLVMRRSGIDPLRPAGLPLGMFRNAQYPVTQTRIAGGESLVLYTDGITEAQDAEGNLFGEAGLMDLLERLAGGDAAALAQGVVRALARFRGGGRAADDITVLALRRAAR